MMNDVMSNELERMWKETLWCSFDAHYPGILSERIEENYTKP
jgi:hypothetical protein